MGCAATCDAPPGAVGDRTGDLAGSGVVIKRVETEKDRPQGDIVWCISRSLLQTNKALFEPYASKNIAATPAEYRDPDNLWIGNNLHLLVILQNTKILPADQGPKLTLIPEIPWSRRRQASPSRKALAAP